MCIPMIGIDPQAFLTSTLAKISQTKLSELDQFLPDVWKADALCESPIGAPTTIGGVNSLSAMGVGAGLNVLLSTRAALPLLPPGRVLPSHAKDQINNRTSVGGRPWALGLRDPVESNFPATSSRCHLRMVTYRNATRSRVMNGNSKCFAMAGCT
jgi:hypothetical protein